MIILSNADLLKKIQNDGIVYIDFRFTDPRGVWHHMSFHANAVDEDLLETGIMFDGSSIAGWRSIENSDMILMPDPTTTWADPFSPYPTLVVTCDILDPSTGKGYNRDPRSIAKRAETYLINSGLADRAFFGPEPEYFVFDQVHYDTSATHAFYHLHSSEISCLNNSIFGQNSPFTTHQGHAFNQGGGYCPAGPADTQEELRARTLSALEKVGIRIQKHHHEVAPAQHELGFEYNTLLKMADALQAFKYIVKTVAHKNGKTATFMPKPIQGDNGSGMHVHQSLWLGDHPLFYGNRYNELSQEALYYVGGILKHAKALNAFTNATTNSYKRLVPGYEAPVYLSYSARNRSAAIRIPHTENWRAKRIEVRFPDPAANPYLALSAMLMAGLDGIMNKIDPGAAMEKNLYKEDASTLDNMCTSLKEALDHLNQDRAFLTEGGVFDDDQIEGYIALKRSEMEEVEKGPTPGEFKMYYSL